MTHLFSKVFGRKSVKEKRESVREGMGDAKKVSVDEYGYQIVNISEPLLKITFPSGDEIRTPTDLFKKIIDEGYNN